jgi:hypothetical protein
MNTMTNPVDIGDWMAAAAFVALGATTVSGAALLVLHALNPDFAPSWRMVSEYANGRLPWLLTVVFMAWAISSFALAAALWPLSANTLGTVGLLFLVLAGVGQTMGGLFDINHRLHGPAALIGIPSLCVAAIVVTSALSRRTGIDAPPVWSAHLPWLSFVAMLGAFALFFVSLKAAGVDMSAQSKPLAELPVGVSGYVGWANRVLFAATYLWVVFAALRVLQAKAG